MFRRGLILTLGVTFTFAICAPAKAVLVLSNLAESQDFNTGANPIATSFTTGGVEPLTLDFFTIRVNTGGSDINYTGSIFADGGGSPGALLGQAVVFQAGGTGLNDAVFDIPDITLSPNTTYWVQGSHDLGFSAVFATTISDNEASGFGWTLGNDRFPTSGLNDSLMVSFDAITAVPEPSTFAMLALAGIGGIWTLRRKRKSESTETES